MGLVKVMDEVSSVFGSSGFLIIGNADVLPTVEEIMPRLPGLKVFTSLDASNRFHQILLHEDSSRRLTTSIIPFGRYVFHHLPFGITSAPGKWKKP